MKGGFRNPAANALGFLIPLAVTFFTTPFLVNRLTPFGYGIFVLALSLMGVFSFLDLGLGQAVVKYVSQYEARGDRERVGRILGTSLFLLAGLGAAAGLLVALSAPLLARLFGLSAAEAAGAAGAFRLAGAGLFIAVAGNAFTAVPKALQRYDLAVAVQNAVWLSATSAVVFVLWGGGGVVSALAAWVGVQAGGVVLSGLVARRLLPGVPFRPAFDREAFREMAGFGLFTAANAIASSVVSRLDKILLGMFLGPGMVALYSVPFLVAQKQGDLLNSMTQHLFPAVSELAGTGREDRLAALFRRSTRYALSLALVGSSLLVALGEPFLALWMGPGFAQGSRGVLPVLSLVFAATGISAVGFWFFAGLGMAKVNTLSSLAGSACFLLGALVLIPRWGLPGAAWAFALILVPFPFYTRSLLARVGVPWTWFAGLLLRGGVVVAAAFAARALIGPTLGWGGLLGWGALVPVVACALLLLLGVFDRAEVPVLLRKVGAGGKGPEGGAR